MCLDVCTDDPLTCSEVRPTVDQRRICFELGMTKYPRIEWSWESFTSQWNARGESERGIAANQDDYVRLACLANRPGSWEVLDAEYIQPLRRSVLRVCPSLEATDAALQQFRCLLAAPTSKLAAYRPAGSFRAWLRVVAVRTALDLNRQARARSSREDELTERLEVLTAGPETRYLREEIKAELRGALRAAARRLPVDERQALHLHVVAGWNISQIGRTLSVHRSTAARMLVSARKSLRDALRAELSARKGSVFEDTSEAWPDLPSRLDLSLAHLFANTGENAATESSAGGRP